MVFRVENLDRERSKPQFIDAVQGDFEKLGLTWDEGPYFFSITAMKPTRRRSIRSLSAAWYTRAFARRLQCGLAPHHGKNSRVCGTCRALTAKQRAEKAAVRKPAMRLVAR